MCALEKRFKTPFQPQTRNLFRHKFLRLKLRLKFIRAVFMLFAIYPAFRRRYYP